MPAGPGYSASRLLGVFGDSATRGPTGKREQQASSSKQVAASRKIGVYSIRLACPVWSLEWGRMDVTCCCGLCCRLSTVACQLWPVPRHHITPCRYYLLTYLPTSYYLYTDTYLLSQLTVSLPFIVLRILINLLTQTPYSHTTGWITSGPPRIRLGSAAST